MKLGRPKEFDRKDALERAMEEFWAKGYEATSVSCLLEAMGINRGSMYDTFGDKRSLFLEAIGHYRQTVAAPLIETIGHYRQTVAAPLIETLNGAGSPLGNIRRTLSEFAELAASDGGRGCLVTNTTVEIAPQDAEIAKAMKSALIAVEEAFRKALSRAVERGELGRRTDARCLARFLANTLHGLVVLSKAKLGRQTRNDVIKVTMAALAA